MEAGLGQFIMGTVLAFVMGLFALQFQDGHPFNSHIHLYALCQVAILMAFFTSAVIILMESHSAVEEAGFWFVVMAFTSLISVCMLEALKFAVWFALGLLVVWRLRGQFKRILEAIKMYWEKLIDLINGYWTGRD
ncbi:hypothetical protein AMTR_s00022p00070070 [Amborella trichopoda]|uniref:Uncharacterized protein n=1 Tax=Amborella trichopoda TaxID=13333 RepID=W1PUR7_AMBTC|nr:hypothetical protein AMTR_s00022p00070070 [Amborella trichopoda]